jgi:hypothetical protein
LMPTMFVTVVQLMKLLLMVDVFANLIIWEIISQMYVRSLVNQLNLFINKNVLRAHWIFNIEVKLKAVLATMDIMLIIMEFARKLF